jgi:8-oxo-dGTP pyrophosphatase MutT (NUDIX family)
MEVHESRLIVFEGAPTAQRERLINRGWSLSVMQRAYDVLRQFNVGWQAVENMMSDGAQGVWKMSGLTEMQSTDGGEAAIQKRIRDLDLYRSTVRAIVIDGDNPNESFERLSTSFDAIPAVLEKFMLRLAATVEIPVTILMGQSPAGMNATGESDFRWFYDRIRSQQTTMLSPRIRRLVQVWLRTRAGREAMAASKADVKAVTIRFPPLWTDTPAAVADRQLKVAQTDQAYLTMNVLTPEEIALARFRPGGLDAQIVLTDEQVAMRETMVTAQLSQMVGELSSGDATTIDPAAASSAAESGISPDDAEARTDAGPLAACVLITNGPLVLAVSRKDDPTAYGLPGGKVDPGETPMEAAVRELREETGYEITDLKAVFTSTEADGFTTTTFTGTLGGKFGTTEAGQVSWVHPEALFRGPFAEYNRKLWAKLGWLKPDPSG